MAALIVQAEQAAPDIQPVLTELERTIAELMDAITTESDQSRKMVMFALEYGARMVRERWLKQGQN